MGALVCAILPLLFALTLVGDTFAWGSYQFAALVLASAAAAFALVRIERRADDPVVPLVAFRDRTFVVVSIVGFLTGVGLFGSLAYMPLFIQGVIGSSATNSGLVNTPLMLSLTLGSLFAGNVAARSLHYRAMVVGGGAIVAAGMLIMATLNESSPVVMPLAGMAVIGLGLGVTMPLMGLAVQNALPQSLLGVASASQQFFRQIGGTLGMALAGTLVTTRVHGGLEDRLPRDLVAVATPETLRQLETPALLLSPSQMDRMRDAFASFGPNGATLYADTVAAMRGVLADGLHEVFIGGFVVAILAVAISALMPNVVLQTRIEETTAGVPAPAIAKSPQRPVRASGCRLAGGIRKISALAPDDIVGARNVTVDNSATEATHGEPS